MAAPNFAQISEFSRISSELKQRAVTEFINLLSPEMQYEEVIALATSVAVKYRKMGAELGAQWYDLCTQLAEVDAQPAEIQPEDMEHVATKARDAVDRAATEPPESVFNRYLTDMVAESIRQTGQDNLWRDYERGIAPGRWARVPVGDTCAWCLTLASAGAWYLTEQSALGREAGHYHNHCNCVAVYHAEPTSIRGYQGMLTEYKTMYYNADNIRIANNNGKEPYPDDLRERVEMAKREHDAKHDESPDTVPAWSDTNEDLIIMRYKYGLK